jgi:type II secretory pathway component PulF
MLPAFAPYQPPDQADLKIQTSADLGQATNGRSPQVGSEISKPPRFSLRPVWRGHVLLTLNQLSVMSKNGIELADALESVAMHCCDARLASSLRTIHTAVNSGHSLSNAVAAHGEYFPSTLAPMLAAAEITGDVPETLGRVCQRMRGEMQMRGTLVGAMIYPAILISVSTIVMTALVLGVLPQFSRVFASMGKTVPVYTQALLSFGDFGRDYWIGILAAFIGASVAFVMLRRHAIIQRPLSRFLMYGPMIREAYRPLQAGRNLRTIAAMVQGGVPLLQAVQLSQQTTGDIYWKDLLRRIEVNLIDGLTASSAMTNVDFIPPETAQLMSTAERTGRVASVLEDIGEFYEEEAGRRIKRLVLMVEPLIILVMGMVVAGIVMSVMLPLLDISTTG